MKKLFKTKRSVLLAIIAIAMLIPFSGCKKFLDTQRQGQYTEENYPYPGGSGPYDQFIFGAYNDLRSYNIHVFGFLHAVSIRSDDADKGSTAADGGADSNGMDNFPVITNSGLANSLWIGNLGLVNKCNNTLYQIKNNIDITATPEIKIQTEAEARFLRAYAYFNLVRFFGRVPLFDSLVTDPAAQNNRPQSSPAQLYAFIESDLQFAAANLPASWDQTFVGRATSGAANGILAKVYLTQQKWALAMSTANLVMTSGKYDLSTPYTTIFEEEGENSKESVFEIQGTADASVPTANGIQYTQVQSVRGSGIWNLGWGFNSPSQILENAYEANDPRRARTILFTSTVSTPGYTIYGELTPVGLPNPRYNQKVYTKAARRSSVGSASGWWMNIRILRFADVVLMYAEAANEVGGAGNITIARNALNSVRARARQGAPGGTLPDVTTTDQDMLRDAIRYERRIELAMEHDRFFDIVRWGISGTVMQAAGKANFSPSRDNLLPIPQQQIDLSGGVLTQNFGY
ncbi:MAG: RagB/SusD family nutrient uptake outer membrane protein [Chitinophagaceae bacterium]|nr:RagB/SusD family nutrient uptake outer membrane protein [Chitinophagaceae bacterium]